MPDMPMPPMPTKWIVPMSVPKAFIIESVLAKDAPSSCRHGSVRSFGGDAGRQRETHGNRSNSVADTLNEVGKIARRVRPPDRQRAPGGIVERHGIHRQRLDLAREDVRREVRLLDHPCATGLHHLAGVCGLVVV